MNCLKRTEAHIDALNFYQSIRICNSLITCYIYFECRSYLISIHSKPQVPRKIDTNTNAAHKTQIDWNFDFETFSLWVCFDHLIGSITAFSANSHYDIRKILCLVTNAFRFSTFLYVKHTTGKRHLYPIILHTWRSLYNTKVTQYMWKQKRKQLKWKEFK